MAKTKKMNKKQQRERLGLNVSIAQLRDLMFFLKKEGKKSPVEIPDDAKWLIDIVNDEPECCDTWELNMEGME